MLNKLEIINFKAFSNFSINFREFNLLIGKNNQGKSTITDALKILSKCIGYKRYTNPILVTTETGEQIEGFILDNDKMPISLFNLRNEYKDEDTIIRAYFDNHFIITIIFSKEDTTCYFYFMLHKQNITNPNMILNNFRDNLIVIPPLGLFDENEELLTKKHITDSYGTYLTPRHFRNFWHYYNENFEEFNTLMSKTWESITVQEPELNRGIIKMYYLEKRITREISWAGSGLMIWMQLLSHISKAKNFSTIILDEPDVYLHSDLQRKLIQLLKQFNVQIILATHSIELINEVLPENITYVDKKLKHAKNLKDFVDVQNSINELGSTQNIQITKLINSRKCLIVEGEDFKILKKIAEILGFLDFYDGGLFSVIRLEGFSNWEKLKNSTWYFENVIGQKIELYVVLDRDYYSDSYIEIISADFRKNNLKFHIWKKKEIENYFLNPKNLYEVYISESEAKDKEPMKYEKFLDLINRLSSLLYDDTFSQRLSNHITRKRSTLDSIQIKNFKKGFDKEWKDLILRLNMISGKEMFKKLSFELNKSYSIVINLDTILKHISRDKLDLELIETVTEIHSLFK